MCNYSAPTQVLQAPMLNNDFKLPPETAEIIGDGHWLEWDLFADVQCVETIADTDYLATLLVAWGAKLNPAPYFWFCCEMVGWRRQIGIDLAEEGWRLYRLAGIDGQVRARDRSAPSVALTPRGQAIYIASPRHKPRAIISIAELAEITAAHCPARGVV